MERFEEFKDEILQRAKKARTCKGQYIRAYNSLSFTELMAVIRDNFCWASRNNVIDGEMIDLYANEFNAGNIWHNCNIRNSYIYASGSSMVKAFGSSTVYASDNSTVEAFGSSTVEASGSSTVEASDNSTVKAYDSSTVKASGSSYIYSQSFRTCKVSGMAIVRCGNTLLYASDELKFERVNEQSNDTDD